MPSDYTEELLVEEPAAGLFEALGWQAVSARSETFGEGGTLGRETRGEVVLVPRLRAALAKLNPTLPPEAIATAVDELVRDRSAMSLEAANREVYRLLKDGIQVSVPDREHGGQKTERLRVIDWEEPGEQRFPARPPAQRHRLALHLPSGPGRLRERPAVGGDRAEEARRAGAQRLR